MATAEQRRRETPPQRGYIKDVYGIETAGKEIHDKLQRIRIAMVDETSNPEASKLLHTGIETGKEGGRQQGKALMIQTLQRAGKPNEEIGDLLEIFDRLEASQFGDTTPATRQANSPLSER